MTSREVADLVNIRHDNVKRTIDRLADQGVIGLPQSEDVLNKVGQSVKQYIFSGEKGKRDSLVVVAQLSPEFTGRLVDRWLELEAQQQPKTLPEMMVVWAQAMVEQERRLARLEAAQPTPKTHTTIRAYCAIHQIEVDLKTLQRLGRRAAHITIAEGKVAWPIPDDLYGTVNSYPIAIVEKVFADLKK